MMEDIYSIKMRSARDTKHISGAESIILEKDMGLVVQQLITRALGHSRGKPDFINIKIQNIVNQNIEYIAPLDITTVKVNNYFKGRECAIKALQKSGLSIETSHLVLNMLKDCNTMRGAILFEINSRERLEADSKRGVRVTNIDWSFKVKQELDKALARVSLNNNHVKEAVALASKVCSAPGIIAELCWSDDPDYTAGYVASKDMGYMRITKLKPLGSNNGGRVFCFDSSKGSIEKCIKYLEEKITLLNKIPKINTSISYSNFSPDISSDNNEVY